MALTASNEFPLGRKAPDFLLLNTVDNTALSLSEAKGEKGTVIMFICNHCPFVIHVNDELVKKYRFKKKTFLGPRSGIISHSVSLFFV